MIICEWGGFINKQEEVERDRQADDEYCMYV